jgi:hypothetical protein
MRLRRSEVEYIARQIVEQLLSGDYMKTEDVEAASAQVTKIISADLMVEDQLNEEVRQILEDHAEEVQRGGVEYYRMFNLIKAKLIRERNLIL